MYNSILEYFKRIFINVNKAIIFVFIFFINGCKNNDVNLMYKNVSDKITVHFNRSFDIKGAILELIRKSEKKVFFAYFNITDPNFALYIETASKRGVEIIGIMDHSCVKNNKTANRLIEKGFLKLVLMENNGLMHNKFIIVDDKVVATGSANITKNSSLWNNENLVIITDPLIAKKYEKAFYNIYNQSK
jgi:phospholipase D